MVQICTCSWWILFGFGCITQLSSWAAACVAMNPKDTVDVATVPKKLVAVVKDLKDPAGFATDPMNIRIDPQ